MDGATTFGCGNSRPGMEPAARRFEPAHCGSVRRQTVAQPAMDAEIRDRIWSQACASWQNNDGSETVCTPNRSWRVGDNACNCPPDAGCTRAWRPTSADGQSIGRPAEHVDYLDIDGRPEIRVLLPCQFGPACRVAWPIF